MNICVSFPWKKKYNNRLLNFFLKLKHHYQSYFCHFAGPPGIPEGPIEAVDITDDALTLIWKKPLDDGGFPIERYRIEIKGTLGWNQVYCNNPDETRYRFSKLKAGINYQFRVRAVNQKYAGDFIEKEVTTRTPKGMSCLRIF